ncbi:hypothetical protein A2U01_0073720, partial [Trifolium medium]|nr:hypothetical protein [Trifolium medium]
MSSDLKFSSRAPRHVSLRDAQLPEMTPTACSQNGATRQYPCYYSYDRRNAPYTTARRA